MAYCKKLWAVLHQEKFQNCLRSQINYVEGGKYVHSIFYIELQILRHIVLTDSNVA